MVESCARKEIARSTCFAPEAADLDQSAGSPTPSVHTLYKRVACTQGASRPGRVRRYLRFRRFQKTCELADTGWMAHFAQSLRFDLANALAGDPELPAHFFKCSAISIDQPEALLQHLALALRQGLEHVFDFLFQQNDCCHVARVFRAFVLDEITKIGFLAFPDW